MDHDELIAFQLARAELAQQRDQLAAVNTDLKTAVARMHHTLDNYTRQKADYVIRDQLLYFLAQNTANLHASDDNAAFVTDNLHVLPDPAWHKRHDVLARFYPDIQIGNATLEKRYKDDRLVTELAFTVSSDALPPATVLVTLHREAVEAVHVTCDLAAVCPGLADLFRRNYVPRRKVDLVLAGYNSLAAVQRRRTEILAEILGLYAGHVLSPAHWAHDPSASLRHVPFVDFDFGVRVRLYWRLVVLDPALASVGLDLELVAGDKLLTEPFLRLVPEYGVVGAFKVVIRLLSDP